MEQQSGGGMLNGSWNSPSGTHRIPPGTIVISLSSLTRKLSIYCCFFVAFHPDCVFLFPRFSSNHGGR